MSSVMEFMNEKRNVKVCRLELESNAEIGLQLSRLPWDPYPFVSSVTVNSKADLAGISVGDCLLKINGQNLIGQRIPEVANILRRAQNINNHNYAVELQLWNPSDNCKNASQKLTQLVRSFEKISQLLECPVCLTTVRPPVWQCSMGHIMCCHCKQRSQKCPICRVILGPRGRCLIADKLYSILLDVLSYRIPRTQRQSVT